MKVIIYKEWCDENLDAFAWTRISMRLFPFFFQQGINLMNIDESTEINSEQESKLRRVIYEIFKIEVPSFDKSEENMNLKYNYNRNAVIYYNEPLILHCHHYNIFLQASIEDAKDYVSVYPILIDSAQEIAYNHFSKCFFENELDVDSRKGRIENFYSACGFGKINLGNISNKGGSITTPYEHYAIGWKSKMAPRDASEPGVSFFATGFLAGAVEAIYDLPLGTVESIQTKCLSKGDDVCEFEIKTATKQRNLGKSPEDGNYTEEVLSQPPNTDVDYKAIQKAVAEMGMKGDEETGLINAFGVMLTRMYANYYTLISYRFLKEMHKVYGNAGLDIAVQLLTEAGHVCAFNTLGGIMESAEWEAIVQPMIKTKEDWVHGIIAVVNAFGWGFYEIQELEADNKRLVIHLKSGYESNSYLAAFGESKFPISFLAKGVTASLMNLIYYGDISQKPTLDQEYYNKIMKGDDVYKGRQSLCRAMGHAYDEFIATV